MDGERSILDALRELPLFDNVYLLMQARNVAIVDQYIRGLERNLLQEYMELEKAPVGSTTFVSALSQMWVFALYELLRTWIQRASDILAYRSYLDSIRKQPDYEANKARAFEKKLNKANAGRAFGSIKDVLYQRRLEQIETDDDFYEQLRLAKEKVVRFNIELEELRMNLAKHEVPGAKGSRIFGAGYGRIDMTTGSIYWMIESRDGYSPIISRQGLADELRNLNEQNSRKAI